MKRMLMLARMLVKIRPYSKDAQFSPLIVTDIRLFNRYKEREREKNKLKPVGKLKYKPRSKFKIPTKQSNLIIILSRKFTFYKRSVK